MWNNNSEFCRFLLDKDLHLVHKVTKMIPINWVGAYYHIQGRNMKSKDGPGSAKVVKTGVESPFYDGWHSMPLSNFITLLLATPTTSFFFSFLRHYSFSTHTQYT